MPSLGDVDMVPPGVMTGDNLRKLFRHAREKGFAIPDFRCSSATTCKAVLEAARLHNSPVAITIQSHCSSSNNNNNDDVEKAVALALFVRTMAPHYGIPVILHSEHCPALLPFLEGLLEADKDHFAQHREPLFSSHALNLTQDPYWEENIAICAKYFANRFVPLKLWLEMVLADCPSHSSLDNDKNTTTMPLPLQIWKAYQTLSNIGDMFSIAPTLTTANANSSITTQDKELTRLENFQAFCHAQLQTTRRTKFAGSAVVKGPSGGHNTKPVHFVLRSRDTRISSHPNMLAQGIIAAGVVKLVGFNPCEFGAPNSSHQSNPQSAGVDHRCSSKMLSALSVPRRRGDGSIHQAEQHIVETCCAVFDQLPLFEYGGKSATTNVGTSPWKRCFDFVVNSVSMLYTFVRHRRVHRHLVSVSHAPSNGMGSYL